MRMKNTIMAILKNRSGASIIYVVAAMLLLIAVGVSVLTAAVAGAGAGINKQNANRLELYSDSIHATVRYSLIEESRNDYNKDAAAVGSAYAPATLGGQIIAAAYVNFIRDETNPDFSLYLTPTLDGDAITADITVSVKPAVISTVSSEYRISASVKITVSIGIGGKSKVSVAEYRLRNVILSPGPAGSGGAERLITNYGQWEFVSYETVDK